MGICPLVGDNIWKRMLIPNVIYGLKVPSPWKVSLEDEPILD
jgi:hypothetical protein